MRTRLAATATELLQEDERVAVLLADISLDRFEDAATRFPERVFNVGIMEQTLVGVAAGFALEGYHPIVHSITPFLVERPYEQIKVDFGFQRLGGVLASIGASYDYGTEGGTHHSPGDVGALLQIPGTEILIPGTSSELEALLRETYSNGSLTYLRTGTRVNGESIDVSPGSVHRVRHGRRATVFAFGPMLSRTLQACEGLDVAICYTATVSPLDPLQLARAIGDGSLLIAVEPWYEGTSTAVLTRALPGRSLRQVSIGVPRAFLSHYGSEDEHDHSLALDASGIRRQIVDALG